MFIGNNNDELLRAFCIMSQRVILTRKVKPLKVEPKRKQV